MDALLIGYESQENLGLRSILSYLLEQGYQAAILPFTPGQYSEILKAVKDQKPKLVGFSLIFQYTLEEFGRLMQFLRENDISAHFTAGGHFPSLCPQETLELLPQLDSIVRFEGELTLCELLSGLDQPENWVKIKGLVFRKGSEIILSAPRPLISDLDTLPFVYRDETLKTAHGVGTAAMLASRGCLFNCSFCSIRQFYAGAPGPLRRVRSPNAVVEEMRWLYDQKQVRFFSFQDDDFAARTPQQRDWLFKFLKELKQAGLADKIGWKISCRVDDLEPAILEEMIAHGLMAVYLGVESGSHAGLEILNKHVNVAQNLSAVELLKHYDVALGMGFMLFDPSSNAQTIAENIAFLRAIGEDGYFPINFCKMLPYAGTPIETQLRIAGRLKGKITEPDYDFGDRATDWYAFIVQRIFARRNFQPEGIVERLQEAEFNYRVAKKFGQVEKENGIGPGLRILISQANALALKTLVDLQNLVLTRDIEDLLSDQDALPTLADREWCGEMKIEFDLMQLYLESFSPT